MKSAFQILLALTLADSASAQTLNTCVKAFENQGTVSNLTKALVSSQSVSSNKALTQPFVDSLNVFFQTLKGQYGPEKLKQQSIGLDLEKLKSTSLDRMSKIKNSSEAYQIMADILLSLNDAHVSFDLPSTKVYGLPIQFAYLPGEAKFVVRFIAEKFVGQAPGVEAGDELVAINGLRPQDFMAKNKAFNADGNPITNKAFFAITLSSISESRGNFLFKGKEPELEFTIRLKSGELKNFNWRYDQKGTSLVGYDLDAKGEGGMAAIEQAELQTIVRGWAESREEERSNTSFTSEASKVISSLKESAERLTFERTHFKPDFNKIESLLSQFDSLFSTRVEIGDSLNETNSLLNLLRKRKADGSKGKLFEMGSIEPSLQLPPDFQPIKVPFPYGSTLLSSGVLRAGTFQHNGKTVGYLRIASYVPQNMPLAYFGLKYFIAQLQQKSDYLVIDQMNNPGGAVIFSDMIIKSLTGTLDPSKHMKFAVKPTVEWLARYAQLIVNMQELGFQTLTKAEVERFTTLLKTDYKKIEDALRKPDPNNQYHKLGLSEPIDLSVMSDFFMLLLDLSLQKAFTSSYPTGFKIYQKVTHKLGMDPTVDQVYTKPVYFMINEFDFSGGDATPANLQDYKRVKTIGTRTAGAGGTVNEFSFQNNGMMDFSFRLTTSLMIRSNADRPYVENYGVLPDLIFNLKSKDYVSGTSAAFQRMMDMIDEDLKKSSVPNAK